MNCRQRQTEADLRAVRWVLNHSSEWSLNYVPWLKKEGWDWYVCHGPTGCEGAGPTAAAALRAARKQVKEST